MWRSLINSARGRSAVVRPAAYEYPRLETFDKAREVAAEPQVASPMAPAATVAEAPRACCVYCGHVLYVPPRLQRIRCPRCSADLPARDICLAGDVSEEQILTAGRITVAAGARVQGQLVACSIDVSGMVLGNLLASHECRLRSAARVAGNILCRRLSIDPGATLEGSVELIRP